MTTQPSQTAFNSQTTIGLTSVHSASHSSANTSTNVVDFSSCAFRPLYNSGGHSLKVLYPGMNVKFRCTHCHREFYGNYEFGEFPLFGFSIMPKCGCFYGYAATNYIGFSFMRCMWKLTTEDSVWRVIVGDTNREYYDRFVTPDADAVTDEDIKIRVCNLDSFDAEVKDDESCYVNGVLMTKEEAKTAIASSTPAVPNPSGAGASMIPAVPNPSGAGASTIPEVLNPNPTAL